MLFWPLTGRVNHKGDVAYGASPRTSTIDHIAGLQAQSRELAAVGREKLFQQQLSSVADRRPELDAMIDFVRDGR